MKTDRKPITSGVLITDGEQFLACRATGHNRYNLPKGMQEKGESPLETCCRECIEETGIYLEPRKLVDLGEFPYLRTKNLHLFLWHTRHLPALKDLRCTSMFLHYRTHQMVAEIDDFRYLGFHETDRWMDKSIARIINQIVSEGLLCITK